MLKQYYHIGFAADTPNGLVVPVIKDADKKGVLQISQEMGELAKKARDGKLEPGRHVRAAASRFLRSAASAGATSRRSSTRPKSRSSASARARSKPVWDGKQFQPRLMLPLSLSWDHRVIDGAVGGALQRLPGRRSWRTSAASCSERDGRPCEPSAMTTVVVVKKPDRSRSRPTRWSPSATRAWRNRFEDNTKIFKVDTDGGPSYLGMAGTVAHFPVLRKAHRLACRASPASSAARTRCSTPSPSCIRYLKDNFFLQTKEEDSDPYESSQFSVVIANATGIYGLYSYREVFEFKEFWGIGSGRSFALGAMHAVYAKAQDRARSRRGRHCRRLRVRPELGRARSTCSPSK